MKFEYIAKTTEKGTRYIMRPSDPEDGRAEMKFLTILRDLGLKEGVTFRVTGAEHVNKDVAGIPPKPVVALSIELIEPAGEEEPAPQLDPLDPNARTPQKARIEKPFGAVTGKGRPVRIIGQVGGDTSIVEEIPKGQTPSS